MSDEIRKKYRLLSGSVGGKIDGERYSAQSWNKANNTVMLTDEEAKGLGKQVEEVKEEEEAVETVTLKYEETEKTEGSDDYSFINDLTIPDVLKVIDSIANRSNLESLRSVELANRNRKGVIAAIDAWEETE